MISDRLRGATRKVLKPGYYGQVQMGTLFYDGSELAVPTKPWASDVDLDGQGNGNIPDRQGTNMNGYAIGSTSSNPDNVLTWHMFVDDKQYLYICDRCLVRTSWDHMNASSLVTGKKMIVDGKRYWCRILTGGVGQRAGTVGTASYGGGFIDNEWHRYILNEADVGDPVFVDAPTPEAADYNVTSDVSAARRSAAHNQAWNWAKMGTWVQDVYAYTNTQRAIRGNLSARYWKVETSSVDTTVCGWRPVLIL